MSDTTRVPLPEKIFEDRLPRLLRDLGKCDSFDSIVIDISRVEFLCPVAVVAILARCHRWVREGKHLAFAGFEECKNLRYLQRIDFLRHLGIDYPEDFTRHPTADRFVPVRSLNFAHGSVDRTASEIARCVLPDSAHDDDVYRALQYATGELISNAKYHSGGRAFISAQFFPNRGLVNIAVADDGQGIRGSFINTTREQDADTPDNAIRLALIPQISSANLRPLANPYGGRNHKGVGLTITRIIARETFGRLTIASESGWFDEIRGKETRRPFEDFNFPGTIVAVSLHRDQVADYATLHEAAMAEIGMGTLDNGGMFID